jgi:hypothetical protein
MAIYFIPAAWALYRAWLLNLKNEIPTAGPLFGLAAGDITAVVNLCTAQIALIDAYDAAVTAQATALAANRSGKGTTDEALAVFIANWKTQVAAGWTDAIAAQLRVVSSHTSFDPFTFKAEYTLKIVGGEIRIDWKKKGVQGMRIYCRVRGTLGWTFLSYDSNSPYIDGNPLANAGVPEEREYMLRGVMNDQEIGLDSDIQSILWSGN